MSVVPIRLFGDPVLRSRAAEVTDFGPDLGRLIDDMFETMDRHNGAGLAATQIGVELRVFVFDCGGMRGHVVNPMWTADGEETQTGPEGCLSIPGIQASCTRPAVVIVNGVNRHGEPQRFAAEDIVARAIAHETDHLDGIMFLQRLDTDVRKGAMRAIRQSEWFAAGITSSDDPGAYPTTWVHDRSGADETAQ